MQGVQDGWQWLQQNWMLVALGVGALVIVAQTILLIRRKPPEGPGLPEEVSGREVTALLAPPERECFNALHLVAGREMHVMAKVALADIAIVRKGVDSKLLEKARRHGEDDVDFILCFKENLNVACAIELQGADDGSKKVRAADILEQVGVPVFRLPRKTSYSVQELRPILEPFLREKPPTPDEMVATVSMEAFRTCKKCRTRMVLKRAKSGKFKGTLFWVCGKYPECKTVELFTR